MSQISSAIDKMSWQIRSIQALRTLNQRAFHWNASIDPSQLGNLLVDDQFKIYEADSGTGLKPKPKDEDAKTYQVFLFETMLLCCLEEQKLQKLQKHRRNGSGSESRSTRKGDVELDLHAQKTGTAYSTWGSWTEWTRNGWSSWGRQRRDLEDGNGQGGEMRSQQQQNGNGSAKTNAARNPEHDPGSRQNSTQSDGDEGHLPRYPIRSWELGSALCKKTPLNLIYAIPTAWMKILSVDEELFSLDWRDNEGGGEKIRAEVVDVFVDEHLSNQVWTAVPFSRLELTFWMMKASIFRVDVIPVLDHESLIGRKVPYSEPSSMYQQKLFEPTELLLSPDMLLELFTLVPLNDKQEQEHVRDSGAGLMSPLELPPSSAYDGKAQRVVDLTGRVEKIGRFPEAHSGFVDVWKGVWKDVHGHERTVAVKVLRSRIGDPKMDDTAQKSYGNLAARAPLQSYDIITRAPTLLARLFLLLPPLPATS
ncbi:hypothetical protein D9758_015248 [Tetrapyrgos nigripes]|uniref:Uncharacterized protein n=1 Tax=Tetrapyrgos nigripes TaxID=182062 RepID=A0A8H5C230_9AGAR|nr:hypothetical protein D9758_015248 [Tetrapyrgos nigripes]